MTILFSYGREEDREKVLLSFGALKEISQGEHFFVGERDLAW